jgi:mRNA interferase HigB
MRVIARSALVHFYTTHPQGQEAREALLAWYDEARRAAWATPAAVKAQYRNASILKSGRVVFNVAGNKFRLVVAIHYNTAIVFVRFVGTHAEYDAIDANTV